MPTSRASHAGWRSSAPPALSASSARSQAPRLRGRSGGPTSEREVAILRAVCEAAVFSARLSLSPTEPRQGFCGELRAAATTRHALGGSGLGASRSRGRRNQSVPRAHRRPRLSPTFGPLRLLRAGASLPLDMDLSMIGGRQVTSPAKKKSALCGHRSDAGLAGASIAVRCFSSLRREAVIANAMGERWVRGGSRGVGDGSGEVLGRPLGVQCPAALRRLVATASGSASPRACRRSCSRYAWRP